MSRIGRLALIVVLVILAAVGVFYANNILLSAAYDLRYVYAGLILLGGVLVTRELASLAAESMQASRPKDALVIKNAVSLTGYLAFTAVALSYAAVSPTALLATAAFSGLVLGLALQPTLGSFFAGILILVSGAIRPGTRVRILTWHIPFQWASNPGYKYFSPDAVYAGYLGEVLEIGLFFTKLLTEEGQVIKFPNTILATDAAVVNYTDNDFIFNVRYEFPNKFDPEVVLGKVKEEVKDFPVVNTFINEQSDKQYYIVKVVVKAKEEDHAEIKSRMLTRLIRLHQELEAKAGSRK